MKILKLSKYNKVKVGFYTVLFLSFLICAQTTTAQLKKQYVVVLDAGHGGRDGGASRGIYIEKKIALSSVLKIGKLLENQKHIKVVYTRKKDVFVELHKRAHIANSNDADLFISVHCNAVVSTKPHGAETFVLGLSGNKQNLEIAKKENAVILLEDNYKQNYDYDPNSPESVIGLSVLQEENLDASLSFADMVQTNFVALKRYDRSVKQANFLVLRQTVMPSVLVELGFISNSAEGKFLYSKTGRTKMAKAVADAIIKYIDRLRLNTVGNNTVEVKSRVAKEIKPKEKVAKYQKPSTKKKTATQKKVVKATKPQRVEKKHKHIPTKKLIAQNKSRIVATESSEPYVVFKVQIGASKKYIPEKPYNFRGLKDVEMKIIDDYYKYYYGSSSDFITIKESLSDLRKKGFKDAFIVAFKNGVKISLKEARRLTNRN